ATALYSTACDLWFVTLPRWRRRSVRRIRVPEEVRTVTGMRRFRPGTRQSEKVMRTLGLSQLIQTKDVLYCNLVTDFLIAGKSLIGPAGRPPGRRGKLLNELRLLNRLSDFQPSRRKRQSHTDYKLLKVSVFFLGAGFLSGIVSSMMIFFTP